MQLVPGENIVLDDGPLGFRKKLTLTNKRLIIQKGKGLFNVTWEIESTIKLDDIEEAYVEPGGAFMVLSKAMLKLKNSHEPLELGLKLSDTQMLGTSLAGDELTDMSVRMKTVNDRWVNAINNQAMRQLLSTQTNRCLNCKKDLPSGKFAFCPFCGNQL
jgi:hypothetical protein